MAAATRHRHWRAILQADPGGRVSPRFWHRLPRNSELIAELEGPAFISRIVTQRRLDRRYS
jgi:hypothetical protein